MIIKITGDKTNEVRYTGETIDSPSDLDWGDRSNYGEDSEVGGVLVNRDGASF